MAIMSRTTGFTNTAANRPTGWLANCSYDAARIAAISSAYILRYRPSCSRTRVRSLWEEEHVQEWYRWHCADLGLFGGSQYAGIQCAGAGRHPQGFDAA